MSQTMLAILVIKTLILVLGSGITFIAYKAHRRTGAPALRTLSVGFGIITLGALLAGVAHQLLGVALQTGVLINSLLVAVGLAIIMYSLYIQK